MGWELAWWTTGLQERVGAGVGAGWQVRGRGEEKVARGGGEAARWARGGGSKGFGSGRVGGRGTGPGEQISQLVSYF